MNEFDNNGYNNDDVSQLRPDYYQPTQADTNQDSNTYYTPPKAEPTYNQNYQYSYMQGNEQGYYQPQQQGDFDQKPPKKSKTVKVIVIVLVVCLGIAAAGLISSGTGKIIENGIADKPSQSQSQKDDKADVNDSDADVPLISNAQSTNYTVAGVAKEAIDSCVGITVYSEQAAAYNYFYGYGQNNNQSNEPTKSGEGSGVLMSESKGKTYIMTCAHVISDGDKFKVTLNDGKEYDAFMVGCDSQTDIGVLAINKTGLKIAEFANSDDLVLGEQVVAIGCPGGLDFMNSVTSGYVSALARPISSSIGYDNECIQTDTAINPGNSGGALFNMKAQVIGINSSKIASYEYEGMGFAVPSKTAVKTANSLIKVGYVEGRAKLGVQYTPITNFNSSSAVIQALADLGYTDAAGTMVIREVNPDSDLANKKIKEYDMIVAVNGKTLTSTDVMTSTLADSKPGDTVKLTIARIDGNNKIKTFDVECKLIEDKGNK